LLFPLTRSGRDAKHRQKGHPFGTINEGTEAASSNNDTGISPYGRPARLHRIASARLETAQLA
jgi:hypothetical protein